MQNELKKNRSRLYPRYDLENSIQFIEAISKLGGNRVSSEAVAAQIGKAINNSTFIGRVSSSKQFGLIVQESGKLSLTPLGKEIVLPRGDAEKQDAIKKAFGEPTLYRELISAFNGKVIDKVTLGNRLTHDYSIEVAAKDGAARNFVRSAEYANVMQNGILVAEVGEPVTDESPASLENPSSMKSFGGDPFAAFFPGVKKPERQPHPFNDSGEGWDLSIKSRKPLNSKVRKLLVDLADLLEEAQEEEKEN